MKQPIHTVYGGAHLFRRDICKKLGELALNTLNTHAPTNPTLLAAIQAQTNLNATHNKLTQNLHQRISQKLSTQPVEDYRIDFEDGFGARSDKEEDECAKNVAQELALAFKQNLLPEFIGIRIKNLGPSTENRALSTLDLVVNEFLKAAAGQLPPNFCITLPKIESESHVQTLRTKLEQLEKQNKLPSNSLKIELVIETPRSILNENGLASIPALIRAAGGRCTSCHYGLHDFTSSLGLAAHAQKLRHPYSDFVRFIMQVCLANTGVRVVDSITNSIPGGTDSAKVHAAWREQHQNITNALNNGIYQGWDLHPGQLPIRYASTYLFFYEGLEQAKMRLKSFQAKSGQATLTGAVFDDQATVLGLQNFFNYAQRCGAITEQEALI